MRSRRLAVRAGIWRSALAAATERRTRPARLRSLSSRRVAGLRVSTGGTGPTTVLVHGVIVSSRYMMPLGAELATDLHVVIPDLPSYGLSEPPREPLTLPLLADAVIAAAGDHDRLALVGNSFGAQVVVEAAVRHPERVERIVLLGPTVDPRARSLLARYVRWQRGAPLEHPAVAPVMARNVSASAAASSREPRARRPSRSPRPSRCGCAAAARATPPRRAATRLLHARVSDDPANGPAGARGARGDGPLARRGAWAARHVGVLGEAHVMPLA